MKIFSKILAAVIISTPLLTAEAASPHVCDFGDVRMEHLKDNFYVIIGGGGNIGVVTGEDGVFLIDDQTAPVTEEILALIREVNDGPIQFVLNTHIHGDHTGGNENMGKEGAIIVAHDNIRGRLIADGMPAGGFPVITFNDKVSIHINGVEARAVFVAGAHTDGDSIIFFKDQNIIHMGDTVFSQCYPFIDTATGGSLEGLLPALEMAMAKMDDDTIVIPGHGPVTDKAGVRAMYDMLVTVEGRIKTLKNEGKTLEEILATDPTAEYEAVWAWGFIDGTKFTTALYNMMED